MRLVIKKESILWCRELTLRVPPPDTCQGVSPDTTGMNNTPRALPIPLQRGLIKGYNTGAL